MGQPESAHGCQRRYALGAVFCFSRDFAGILIVLIPKTSGMGKWYSWDFDCLISVRHLIV